MPVLPRPIEARRWTHPLLLCALILAAAPAAAQRTATVTVSGTVVDAQSGEGVAGVMVEAAPGERRAVTDAAGRFELRLRAGAYMVEVSHLGYGSQRQMVEAREGAQEPLRFSLEPEPVMLERLHVVLDRFAARRNMIAMSSRVLDRRHLARYGGHSVAQVVESAAVPVVPCSSGSLALLTGAGTGTHCIYSRGQVISPTIYIDDMPAIGGMDELASYSPGDTHHVEIFGNGRMIRMYTVSYVEAVVRGRRPLPPFVDLR